MKSPIEQILDYIEGLGSPGTKQYDVLITTISPPKNMDDDFSYMEAVLHVKGKTEEFLEIPLELDLEYYKYCSQRETGRTLIIILLLSDSAVNTILKRLKIVNAFYIDNVKIFN
jgi:hypothetical protein